MAKALCPVVADGHPAGQEKGAPRPPVLPERDIVSRVFQNVPDAWYTKTGCLPFRACHERIHSRAGQIHDGHADLAAQSQLHARAGDAFMTHSSSVPGLTGAPAAPQTTQP